MFKHLYLSDFKGSELLEEKSLEKKAMSREFQKQMQGLVKDHKKEIEVTLDRSSSQAATAFTKASRLISGILNFRWREIKSCNCKPLTCHERKLTFM